MRRRLVLLALDLVLVGLSPFIALALRSNFHPGYSKIEAAGLFSLICVLVAAVILPAVGLNRGFWRYASLSELMRIVLASLLIVLCSVFLAFATNRLDDVARSLPGIQFVVLLCLLGGARAGVRLWRERRHKPAPPQVLLPDTHDNILIIGVGPLAQLYLRALKEHAHRGVNVVGLVAEGNDLPGRLLGSHKVLGQPEDLPDILRRLEVHGAFPTRIIVAELADRLSLTALNALLAVERSTATVVLWVPDLLGLGSDQQPKEQDNADRLAAPPGSDPTTLRECYHPNPRRYDRLKRLIDILGASALILIASPAMCLVATLGLLDLGAPILFWQMRPGRYGYPIKIYKFRTMHGAHNPDGTRIPDHLRSSRLGAFLRRSHLDELPQLFSILVGEMSLIGPRPLLPVDIGPHAAVRLSVRPGLTGWAQVNGGRELSTDEKAALDVWYIQHKSLVLDLHIAIRTVKVLLNGEQINRQAIQAARGITSSPTLPSELPLAGRI